MLRRCLLPLLVLVGLKAQAQQEFTVDDFSPLYYAKIHVAQPQEVFSPGWISIHDKKTGKQLLKVESEELAVELHDGKPKSNVKQLPYGEQSVIISEDFNFDGRKDLAIEDGQFSCYHGPSFQVYLATAKGLQHDAEFTRLAQEYCGMFQVDAKHKRLSTMTKSGCCWHEYAEFEVRHDAPFLVHRLEENMGNFPFGEQVEETWNGSRMVAKTTKLLYLDREGTRIVCAFNLAENGKRVVLFTTEDNVLYYALLRKDGSLEFGFPNPTGEEEPRAFEVRKAGSSVSLQFRNGSARYEIREAVDGKMTVTAQAGAKTLSLTGAAVGKKGGLRPLLTTKLENLTVQP